MTDTGAGPCNNQDNRRHTRPGNQSATFWLLLAFAWLSLSSTLHAHTTSLARVDLTQQGSGLSLELKFSTHDIAIASGLIPNVSAPFTIDGLKAGIDSVERYTTSRLHVFSGQHSCALTDYKANFDESSTLPESITFKAHFDCTEALAPDLIRYQLFFDLDPTHRAIGRYRSGNGSVDEELLFDVGFQEYDLEVPVQTSTAIQRLPALIGIGFEHIVIGIDHVLFVVALVLGTAAIRSLLLIVTAFTIGHSVTLAIAWQGGISLPGYWVEAGIALSIVYVSVENIIAARPAFRSVLALLFGLLHGLGFYSVLSRLSLDQSLLTLFGFNLGVELGQIAIVPLLLPVAILLRKHRTLMLLSNGLIAAMGLYWLWTRLLG